MSTGELLSAVGNKAAIASIAANVGIAASIKAGLVGLVGSWGLSDTAIVISMCVSIMLFFKLRMDLKVRKLEYELMKKKEENNPGKSISLTKK